MAPRTRETRTPSARAVAASQSTTRSTATKKRLGTKGSNTQPKPVAIRFGGTSASQSKRARSQRSPSSTASPTASTTSENSPSQGRGNDSQRPLPSAQGGELIDEDDSLLVKKGREEEKKEEA